MSSSNPHNNDKHLIVDLYLTMPGEVPFLLNLSNIIPLLEKIVNNLELKVLNKAYHQFEPFGYTCLFMLSESHLSFHSYPERSYLAIDFYTCNKNPNFDLFMALIYEYFNGNCRINKKIIER